jgi:hypothetical protein
MNKFWGQHWNAVNLDQKVQWKISKQSLEPEGQFRPSIKPSVVRVPKIAPTTAWLMIRMNEVYTQPRNLQASATLATETR